MRTGPVPGSHCALSPLASRQRSWKARNVQRAATERDPSSGRWVMSPRLPAVGSGSLATMSSSSAMNCCTVATAVLRMLPERCCCSVRQSSSSCATTVSLCSSAGELAIVSTVCSTRRSDGSSAAGDCARAISCETTAGSRCGATALCESIRCTALSASSGSVSDLHASASMSGSSTSSDAASAAACSAALALGVSCSWMARMRSSARSTASLTSGNLRLALVASERRSSSMTPSTLCCGAGGSDALLEALIATR